MVATYDTSGIGAAFAKPTNLGAAYTQAKAAEANCPAGQHYDEFYSICVADSAQPLMSQQAFNPAAAAVGTAPGTGLSTRTVTPNQAATAYGPLLAPEGQIPGAQPFDYTQGTGAAGTLRGDLLQQRQGQTANLPAQILGGYGRISQETAIPYVTPALQAVSGAVGDVLAAPGAVTGIQALEDVGRFVGEAIVPTTGLDIATELIPGGLLAPAAARTGASAGRAAGRGLANVGEAAFRQAVTPEPNVIRVAVTPGAVRPLADESLAAARGSVQVSDPAGVRILGPDEAPLPGEQVYFHGTAGEIRGGLAPDSFLTPDVREAETYARSASILGRQEAGFGRRLLTEEGGFVGDYSGSFSNRSLGLPPNRIGAYERAGSQRSFDPIDRGPGPMVREEPPLTEAMEYVGRGMTLDADAVGIPALDDVRAAMAEISANPKGRTAQLGTLEAQAFIRNTVSEMEAPEAFAAISDRAAYTRGTTPALRAEIAELERVLNEWTDESFEFFDIDKLRPAPRPAAAQVPSARMGQFTPEFRGEQGAVQGGLLYPEEVMATAGARGYQPTMGEALTPAARLDEAPAVMAARGTPPAGQGAAGEGVSASSLPSSSATPPAPTAVAEPPGPPREPPTGTGGGTPPAGGGPGPDPVARLTELIDKARPLPAQTEAIRSVERAQRVAQSSRILEEGGYSGEAFHAATGPLAGEYSRAAFDPVSPQFAPEEVQQLRNMIGESDLRTFEKINTNTALEAVLEGRLNEVRPFEIALLDRVYGTDFALAVARKAAPPSFADKVYEFWLSSILSGPITQLRNIAGNTAAAMTAPVERLGAAAFEPAARRIAGRPTERFWQEVPEQVIGMIHGFPEGVNGALRAIRGGFGESALTESATRAPAIGGLGGRIIRAPLTGLEAMDAFFGAINFEGAYRALALRQARKEGLTGRALELRIADLLANRTDDLIDAATKEKLVRLFRDDPTQIGQAIMNARNTYKPLRFLVPFARTPDRLLAYGIKRSPLGLLDYPMWKRLVSGNPQAVDELAQTMIGSSIALGLGALVANGQLDITGAMPTNAAERDRWYREGRQAFSVKLPGLGWTSYAQIPGLDATLTTLASAKDSFEKGESIDRAVADLGANIGASIFDRSYVSGLADFVEIFSGGGYEDPVDSAMRWAGRQVSGAVPFSGAARQTSQFFDQTVYKPQGIAEELATGIGAGGIAGVPPRLTAFGENARRPFPSPVAISPDKQSAVDAELGRLDKEIGFTGKSIGGVGLNREQQRLYQEAAGKATYAALDALFQSTAWGNLSDIDREKVIDRAVTDARDLVRDPLNAITGAEEWETLTPAQQQQTITALLRRAAEDPEGLLELMGR